jgi:hypothetical protein
MTDDPSRSVEIDDERMRVLGLHSIINDLPDANYATLKFLMNHLDKYVALACSIAWI